MNVVIIEDETLAADKLSRMLRKYDDRIQVAAMLTSVEDSVKFFQEQPAPDLVLADIHLDDGLCFELFQKVTVRCPVIFTTAYDQYAIRAFQVHSIDYLLKPVQYEKLSRSLDKLKSLKQDYLKNPQVPLDELMELIQTGNTYKSRFLVKAGTRIKAVKTEEIAYIYTERKLNMLFATDGRKYPVDYSLDNLITMLDPMLFFRVNRQLIIHIDAVAAIHPYFKGRVKLELHPSLEAEVVISSERTPLFKAWLDK